MEGEKEKFAAQFKPKSNHELNNLVSGRDFGILEKTIVMKPNTQSGTSSSNEQKPSNTIKDPQDWKTGDEEMTGAQRSYLHTLADEAGEKAPDNLTKAEASEKIEDLQQKTGRGK